MPPRTVYYLGTAWLVDQAHPRARIFIWRMRGPVRRGRGWQLHWRSR